MYYSIYSSIVFFLMHNAFSWQMGWYLKERLFSVYCNRYGWFILMSITYIIPQKARFFALIILKIYFCQIFEKWPFSRTFFRFSQKAPIRILCFKVFYNHRGVLFKAKKVSSFELKFFFQTRSSPVWPKAVVMPQGHKKEKEIICYRVSQNCLKIGGVPIKYRSL